MNTPLLEINQLRLGFDTPFGFVPIVHDVDLCVYPGEIVGILGESGSGKTVTLKSIFGVAAEELVIDAGRVRFEDMELLELDEKARQYLRGSTLSYIPQNASDALTPHQTIKQQLKEIGKVHGLPLDQNQIEAKLKAVGIERPEAVLSMYPHQLSGGLAQRVIIAMSTFLTPKLTIADEPTSAIDASLKRMVLSLLKSINEKDRTAMVIITHDFEVVSEICDRVYVMYKGLMMESGPAEALLKSPNHPYTQGLIHCVQSLTDGSSEFYTMKSAEPLPQDSAMCPFAPRCPKAFHDCFSILPPLKLIGSNRSLRCHLEGGVSHE